MILFGMYTLFWNISTLYLFRKLAAFLAMAAACRSLEIYILNVNYMVRKDDCYIFYFHKLTKTWRRDKVLLVLSFIHLPENIKLRVVKTLDWVLLR